MTSSIAPADAPTGAATPAAPRQKLWIAGGATLGAVAMLGVVVGVTALLTPPAAPAALAPPRFVDESATAGIDHGYDGGFTYFVGGGVAAFDCNDDELPELYLAGGASPAALYENVGEPRGALQFRQLTDQTTDLESVTGAYPMDFDGDRVTDLVVLRVGENVLLRGLGNCTFERANEALGFDGGDAWTVGFSATWRASDALPTMAFGNYLVSDENRTCDEHALSTPEGDHYATPASISPGWCTLSMLFSDWDRSGEPDLRITNDRHYYQGGSEQLMHFADDNLVPYTEAEGWQPMQIWGMGIASQDITGDGKPEVVLTSQGDNKLQTLADHAAGPDYRDIALERGTTAHRPFAGEDVMPSTAWHPEFADVNNDSWVDLYLSKGNVEAMPEFAEQDPSNLLLAREDGSFVESADVAGILTFERARGAAVVDLNLDGMLDLVQVNRETNIGLWRNVGWGEAINPTDMGSWLAVRLTGTGNNTDAIGSWIEVRVPGRLQERELTIGGGHASGQLGWVHFGLADQAAAEIRVTWPDGAETDWLTVDAGRMVTVDQASGLAQVVDPG